jgi:crotonobetainyl-CoA:carnitine CoA-transferase CaiB-like acyl-CoA transferase
VEKEAAGMLGPYRVLDLTNERGLLCGKLFADLGADVIKIEKPVGDPARRLGPHYKDEMDPEKSLFWWAFNTSKKGITLDIETGQGKQIFRRLVSTADVVVESFDPGYLESLDLGYPSLSLLNPKIILTSITGFGQTGPYRDFKASDIAVWALSGNAYLTGDPDRGPLAPSFPISYLFGSMQGAIGTLVALYHRSIINRGQHVDASSQVSLVWPVGPEAHGLWEQDKTIVRRQGRWWSRPQTGLDKKTVWINIPLLYQCKDGDITFAAMAGGGLGKSTNALTRWIESEKMAGDALRSVNWLSFDWQTARQEMIDEIAADFSRFFMARSKAELLKEAQNRGIMLYPVFTPEDMLAFEQLIFRHYWVGVDHQDLGTITYPGPFFQSNQESAGTLRRAPHIGEHNQEVYAAELGLSQQELSDLKRAGVI